MCICAYIYIYVYIYIYILMRQPLCNVTLSFVYNKTTTSDISHVIVKEAIPHNATVEFGK